MSENIFDRIVAKSAYVCAGSSVCPPILKVMAKTVA